MLFRVAQTISGIPNNKNNDHHNTMCCLTHLLSVLGEKSLLEGSILMVNDAVTGEESNRGDIPVKVIGERWARTAC